MKKPVRDIQIIKGDFNNLSISEDSDYEGSLAVFLFTPSMKNLNIHYHIDLNKRQAKKLRDWLNKFLEE